MIYSQRHGFVFVKTQKTAGTSIEVLLSGLVGPDDVVTPVEPPERGHEARNHAGRFLPIAELRAGLPAGGALRDLLAARRFYNHMPAALIRARLPRGAWEHSFTFAVERNPWDKTLSRYRSVRARTGQPMPFDAFLRTRHFPIDHSLYTEPKDPRRIIVDRVIPYERLDEGLSEVLAQLGLPFEPPLAFRAKASAPVERPPYQEAYSPEQRDLVARAFAAEIELHGYTFD